MLYRIRLYQSNEECHPPVELKTSDLKTVYRYTMRNYEITNVTKRLCIPSDVLSERKQRNICSDKFKEYLIVKRKGENALELGWGALREEELNNCKKGSLSRYYVDSFSEDKAYILEVYAEYFESFSRFYHQEYLKAKEASNELKKRAGTQ